MNSVLSWILAVMVGALLMIQPALGADKTHEGVVVKTEKGMLTMSMKDGSKEHSHMVPATAKVTCDGRACQIEDIKAGSHVRVTTSDDAAKTVLAVEATTRKK